MPHFISNLKIKNFKSCIDTELLLSPFTVLVGYNNAGKSNSLTALQWLIKKSKQPVTAFTDETQAIEVEGTIEGVSSGILEQMPARQKTSIEPYINHEKLIIRRVQDSPASPVGQINLSVWNESENEWIANPTGIDNAIKGLLPEPIRIGAMENAADDASKAKSTSTIGKLLAAFLEPVKQAHEADLGSHLDEVSRRISADGDLRFNELSTIDDRINEKVSNLFPGMSLKLHFNTPNFDELIKSGTIKVYEDQQEAREFTSYGHGAQRAIQMALIQYLAEFKKDNFDQLTTTLLLIDEPELYLHPFAIEQVREALLLLSTNGYQIILSTHSAQMITPKGAENTLLIRKDATRGTYARTRLSDAIQTIVPNTTHQMEHLFSLSHSTQILFAENVVLTEGKTELRLLPLLFQKISGITLDQEKRVLVPQGGVNNTKKSLSILNAMDLPVKAIVDLDYIKILISDGFLQANDTDILAIKTVLRNLEGSGQITLNTDGFPQRGAVTAAKAYELLAQETDAAQPIESLHQKLLANNIWIWKKGAIEVHLGIVSKNESGWASFKASVENNGVDNTCRDYQGICDLMNWLRR